LLLIGLATASLSCRPAAPPAPIAAAPDPPLLLLERVAAAAARGRVQVLSLEFAAGDGAGRGATRVVVRDDGRGRDVLSVRVVPPPSGVPIVARDADGRRVPARWVADDPETGLTLLRVDEDSPNPRRPSPALPLPAGPPPLGSQVLLIGNPFGLGHSVTRGSIAGLDRRLELGARPLGGLIQVDAALHPGDSGALVVNLRGEWLGLVRSGLAAPGSDASRDHDVGFALPARDALWVAEQLRTRGRVDRAYLGIRIALRPSGEGPGAVLDSVLDDTPAAKAGLRAGDRLVALDGQVITNPRDLTDRLDRTLADADAVIDSYRGPVRERRTIRTASRPARERERESDRPRTAKVDDPRALLEQIEVLKRRVAELEQAREQEQGPPREARADSRR
jgi:S1-C subfamily serine protease